MKMERTVKRFYEELENGKIMGRKCTKCGNIEYPPVIACNRCGCFDTEWVEMSGRGTINEIVLPSRMSDPDCEVFQPYGMCVFQPEEDAREINVIVRGIRPEDKEALEAKMPLPVQASIYQREGYCAVVYDLVDQNE
ncbi:MAG: zinc ribbon domain-containing protein [Lachnospiraceae bacterium]|nr:zinc ribbon domain-containing protein [Lachnospiraceae bacterium]